MPVRKPLFNDGGNLKEMSTSQVDEIVQQTVYQYAQNPSVTLSVVNTGGNLGTISDTRLQAGGHSSSATSYPSEAATAEPSVVTVNYDKISSATTSVTPTSDTGRTWPIWQDSGQIKAMTIEDVKDTFLHPAIDLLVSGSTGDSQGGTYHISTNASVSGSTEVSGSSTPVFTDTGANTSAYQSGSIPEALDQPQTLTNYYLHRINGATSSPTYTSPVFIKTDGNLQIFANATLESLLGEWIRYTAVSSTDGYKIGYNINGSPGTNRGSGMVDQRLNGSGNYQTRFVNANDYRAQEFPNGTLTSINTYYLTIKKY